ncbi:2522_t:CDS:2, partial [Acaulospora morrowiae]
VVESIFYAYRVTGDTKYQKWGWKIFKQLVKHCKTPTGFSGLRDVMMDKNRKGYDDVDNMITREVNKSTIGGNRHHKNYESNWDDMQHSYFLAETLKYLYLLFNDHNLISLDEYVFNTEAHPIRIGGGTTRTNRSKTSFESVK